MERDFDRERREWDMENLHWDMRRKQMEMQMRGGPSLVACCIPWCTCSRRNTASSSRFWTKNLTCVGCCGPTKIFFR